MLPNYRESATGLKVLDWLLAAVCSAHTYTCTMYIYMYIIDSAIRVDRQNTMFILLLNTYNAGKILHQYI